MHPAASGERSSVLLGPGTRPPRARDRPHSPAWEEDAHEITRPIERRFLGLGSREPDAERYAVHFRIVLREAAADGLLAERRCAKPSPSPKIIAAGISHCRCSASCSRQASRHREDLGPAWNTPRSSWCSRAQGLSGEARALAWECLLPGGWLRGNRAWKADRPPNTKTGDERVLPLPSNTLEALEWWRKESAYTEPEDLIFHGLEGGRSPLESSTLVRVFPRALRDAGIEVGERYITAHSLRHGFNTRYRPLLPEAALHALTGHRTPEMSAHYDHPDIQARMAKIEPFRGLIEAAWSGEKKKGRSSPAASLLNSTGDAEGGRAE